MTSQTTITTTKIVAPTDVQTAATTAAAPTAHHLDPATLVIRTNVRLDTRVDAEFVASIKARGVLQLIVAVHSAGGGHVVRYGQRRRLAAVAAKVTIVPVLVVEDSEDAPRVIDQMAEIDHRRALTAEERLAGFEQLAAFGMSAGQIAQRIATDAKEVEAALRVATSATVTAALSVRTLTFTQAAVVAEFDDDESALAQLDRALDRGHFDHVTQRLRDIRVDQARTEAFATAPRADGHTILTGRPGWNDPATQLRDLLRDGQPVAEDATGEGWCCWW